VGLGLEPQGSAIVSFEAPGRRRRAAGGGRCEGFGAGWARATELPPLQHRAGHRPRARGAHGRAGSALCGLVPALRRDHIGEEEPVPLDGIADRHRDRGAEVRPVDDDRVELTVLSALINPGRKLR
jgi:hypothetical protein